MIDPSRINDAAFRYYTGLRKVKDFVDSHFESPISLAAAAHAAGLEQKYFSTFFHTKAGIRFRDWLAYIRVSKAIEMMKDQNYTITQIALSVGFQDLRTFERAFKKCTGLTPQELKRSVRPC